MAVCWSSVVVLFLSALIFAAISLPASAQLSYDFYEKSCPKAMDTIRSIVGRAITRERRIGASLLRLHFHDCFVNGCDGSILLDDTDSFTGEKTADEPNLNSARGFEVIDQIKKELNQKCSGNVVSCADILAIACRDSVAILGGPSYKLKVGRRDSRTASLSDANNSLPPPFFNFSQLVSSFKSQGLDLKDLVVLSGGHTIGLARCANFRAHIYNDTNINPKFAASVRKVCPATGSRDNTAALDETAARFDNVYFKDLVRSNGLVHSDQELFRGDGSASDRLVRYYSNNPVVFYKDFSESMIKMSNISVLHGNDGEIRMDCRKIN